MQRFLVSYDLRSSYPSPHIAVLDQAATFRWYSWMPVANGCDYKLPNTNLQGFFENADNALAWFLALVDAASADIGHLIEVEKLAVVPIGIGWYRSDRQYAPAPLQVPAIPVYPKNSLASLFTNGPR